MNTRVGRGEGKRAKESHKGFINNGDGFGVHEGFEEVGEGEGGEGEGFGEIGEEAPDHEGVGKGFLWIYFKLN